MNELKPNKYDTDSPETKDQAEELLKEYYKKHRTEKNFPRRHNLLSWKLNHDGTMTVVDGASGRKLEFVVDESAQAKEAELETAEAAEEALLDAETKVAEAEAQAKAAKAEFENLTAQTKANKKLAKANQDRKEKDSIATTKAN